MGLPWTAAPEFSDHSTGDLGESARVQHPALSQGALMTKFLCFYGRELDIRRNGNYLIAEPVCHFNAGSHFLLFWQVSR